MASSIRGSNSRILENACGGMLDEPSCLNEACAWCEFKYDIYDPICLRKIDILSLPTGFYTCNAKQPEETSQPTPSPSAGRNGAPLLVDLTTSPPSSKPSTIPSPVPSEIPSSIPSSPHSTYEPSLAPSSGRDGAPPLVDLTSNPTPAPTSTALCGSMLDESSCLNEACAWCEFKDGIFAPTCLSKINILSLPTGLYTCNVKQPNETSQPTHSPSSDRDGSPPLADLTTSPPSATPPQTSLAPSSSRNGAPPEADVTFKPDPFSSEDVFSCFDISDEGLCRDEACKWCEFNYEAYPPACLKRIDTLSLLPGLATCT